MVLNLLFVTVHLYLYIIYISIWNSLLNHKDGYVGYGWQSVLKINCYSSYFTKCFHIHALISFVIIKYHNYNHNIFIPYVRKKANWERLLYLS